MANFIGTGTVLHWYKKRVPNFTTQSNKKCAYVHMYNYMYLSVSARSFIFATEIGLDLGSL